ncbi:MAG: HypC/HybG/HupF family hydrogenase formation chaperone [Thermoanaerobaculum sp.]|nr:HypC/HybG/HupF family hydrogenase formation chaperone [Thermoanaerobaculum sp.]MDW7967196.1 HypC/HybG/HupF family hydrogenase formation chaperone [Thermoanaerobaculum sp.]
MCLAVPMKLVSREELKGVVELSGVRREVSLMLLPEAEVGRYVLVHAGYAISQVDEEEAETTLALLREALAAEGV